MVALGYELFINSLVDFYDSGFLGILSSKRGKYPKETCF
jgi:hypothetical protein